MPKVVNIEPTPNPDALKFIVQRPLLRSGTRSFRDFGAAVGDPLASRLFALGHITSVFYMDRFVTVNKAMEDEWSGLIDPICEAIEDLEMDAVDGDAPHPGASLADDEKLARINKLLDERIRPGLAGDGGGLEVLSFEDNVLQISYHGACGSCPSSGTGTLRFIEGLLQDEVDPAIRVISY
ncbi:NifU family protein [Mesoterricola sediminis]|uniref:Iron transporter n=1 Tax=Mesoterricola sediminis TaxID=2927980 RepID=A0AA48KD38_9BACT|nr:NifU family protein [Mesoterricola sediminis]BDU77781.1 iron transporter [Mesoterricola sediminis]